MLSPSCFLLGLGEIQQAIKLKSFIENAWSKEAVEDPGLAFLHCVVSYPTPDDQAFLSNIDSIKQLQVTPGYSDHTIGTKAAELSVACGAKIIEKHFTLDKNYSDFRDHQLSADPKGFRKSLFRRPSCRKTIRVLRVLYAGMRKRK